MEVVVKYRYENESCEDFTANKFYDVVINENALVKADGGEWLKVEADIAPHFKPMLVTKCECPRCYGDDIDHGYKCWVCEGQGFEWKTAMAWVNVYTVSRCYGGPEEGGWYYDAYQFIEGHPVPRSVAETLKDELIKRYNDLKYGDISSVLGGQDYSVWVEDHEAQSETRERPRYE